MTGLDVFGHCIFRSADSALPLHYHKDCFEIHYIVKGCVFFNIAGVTYELSGRDVFITKPDEVHSTGNHPMSISEIYWMQINCKTEKFLTLAPSWAPVIIKSLYDMQTKALTLKTDFKPSLDLAFNLLQSTGKSDKLRGANHLLNFIYEITDSSVSGAKKITDDICSAQLYIDNHLLEYIEIQDLAQSAGLSVSRLKQKFKEQVGVTPREYINMKKIDLAKSLLIRNASVTKTAFDLGFSSSNYFATVFKRFTSISPSKYLEIHLNDYN